ncbi:MAG TPA: serine hydrolase [Acetivibrio sp.]|nr:serine hydrolase [Acetivibrio sp.]HPT91838.1 serine hydrolase [Acetivibrio sp.]
MGLNGNFHSRKNSIRKRKGKRLKRFSAASIILLLIIVAFAFYTNNAIKKHYGFESEKSMNKDAGARVYKGYSGISAAEENREANLSMNLKGKNVIGDEQSTGSVIFGEGGKEQDEDAVENDEDENELDKDAAKENDDKEERDKGTGKDDGDKKERDERSDSHDESVQYRDEDGQKDVDYRILKNNLEVYISGLAGIYGIYFVDLETDEQFGINEKEEFLAASTFKIPLNMYIYKKIRDGEIKPTDTIEYTEEDYEEGAGIIRYEKAFGIKYTVKELQRLSIVYSDNVAVNMLLRRVGKDNVKDYMRELGGQVVDYNKNVTCPKDMALYLKKAYELYEKKDKYANELIKNMIETNFHDRLTVLLSKDVKVAHKTGNLIGVVHDVGIVFAKRPYIIVVMSKDVVSDEAANNAIARISKMVYDYIKKEV